MTLSGSAVHQHAAMSTLVPIAGNNRPPEPVPIIDRGFDHLGAKEERAIIDQINPPPAALCRRVPDRP